MFKQLQQVGKAFSKLCRQQVRWCLVTLPYYFALG